MLFALSYPAVALERVDRQVKDDFIFAGAGLSPSLPLLLLWVILSREGS
jgi:hypothetical protein